MTATSNKPRGIKNNNPGNIRLSADNWRGLKEKQRDPDFFQFTDEVFGIRALVKLLRNYQRKYGLNTIAAIISRYAPSNENNTQAYIDSVARRVGVDPYQQINVDDIMPQLVEAIIYHENGQQPYSAATIEAGILLA